MPVEPEKTLEPYTASYTQNSHTATATLTRILRKMDRLSLAAEVLLQLALVEDVNVLGADVTESGIRSGLAHWIWDSGEV